MNTRMQTDAWISLTIIVLGLIFVASMTSILILMTAGQPIPEFFVAIGFVATSRLIWMLISPLTPKLME